MCDGEMTGCCLHLAQISDAGLSDVRKAAAVKWNRKKMWERSEHVEWISEKK